MSHPGSAELALQRLKMLQELLAKWRSRNDGPYEDYHDSGELWMKGSYSDGKEDGPFESFFKNGQPEWVCSFAKGELHGPFESYHEDGQLESKGSYSHGKKCGEWTEGVETVRYPSCPPARD